MRRTAAVLLAFAVAGAVTSAAPSAYADARAAIPGSQPAWATPGARVADAPSAQQVTFRVYLKMRDQAGAEATANAVSDPASGSFRRYLTPDQVRARFAPTADAVHAVSGWLGSSGFTVGTVPSNSAFVQATGSVAQLQAAFGVHLNTYRVAGQALRASDRQLSVPSPMSQFVLGAVGVDQAQNLLKPHNVGGPSDNPAVDPKSSSSKPGTVPPPDGFRNARPCSDFWGQKLDTTDPAFGGGFPSPLPYAPCGYVPSQLRAASGIEGAVAHGVDGRGATVAIVDAFASPTIFADAGEYARRNDPAHPLRTNQFRQVIFPTNSALEPPDQCDAAGWYGEETLDVEAVHAMAPGANIVYVGGSDCQDASLDAALNEVVSKNLAQAVSNSYGNLGEDIPADEVQAFQTIAIQAALEGIGVYFSSGDSGDDVAALGIPSPDFSASSPFVTAVGGTSLGIGADGRKVIETGWETGKSTLKAGVYSPAAPGAFLYGSGGGTSRLFAEPFYQRGVVPDALARQNQTGNARGRVVPDISMVGDPNTGMLIGVTQTFPEGAHYDQYRIGGTSLSSPLLAGVMAVSDQLTHVRHGFINPWLYKVTARTGALTDVVHQNGADVRVDFVNGLDATGGTVTSIRSFDLAGQAISTTRGYDNVTGLGTPNGLAFLLLS